MRQFSLYAATVLVQIRLKSLSLIVKSLILSDAQNIKYYKFIAQCCSAYKPYKKHMLYLLHVI